MKRFQISMFLLMVCANNIIAQIQFLDSVTKISIPAVNVYNDKGDLLAISDSAGQIPSQQLSHFLLLAQHIAYKNKNWVVNQPEKDTIYLSPATINLSPVEVKIVQSADYVLLTGYYRTSQFYKGRHKYFSEGIVSYYVPLHKDNKSIKYELSAFRVFAHKKVVKVFKNELGFMEEPPSIPSLEKVALKDLQRKKTYQVAADKNIYKENSIVGNITNSPDHSLTIYLDYVRPNSFKKRKVLGMEVTILQNVRVEKYDADTISQAHIKKLQALYQNSTINIKRKKITQPSRFDVLSEFHLIEKKYISKQQYEPLKKKLKSSIFLPLKSSDEKMLFLKKLIDTYSIPALPPSIEKSLYKELELL